MNSNAGVILTDEEVRQLTEAGCEIYPMQRIEVDENAHLRKDINNVSVLAKYKSRLFGCGNFETTEGFRTDSPSGDVDSHNIVRSWCAHAHVSIHACDFTNGYFQGQEMIESCCTVFQLKVFQKNESQAERFRPRVFSSMVSKMLDEDCGFEEHV